MKAIHTKYHPATAYRQARISAKAEGLPAKFYGDTPEAQGNQSVEQRHARAAAIYVNDFEWAGSLTSGMLPDGSFAHVFTPAVDALRAVLRGACLGTLRQPGNPYAQPLIKRGLRVLAQHDGMPGHLQVDLSPRDGADPEA